MTTVIRSTYFSHIEVIHNNVVFTTYKICENSNNASKNDVIENLLMNACCQMMSLEIYEWMRKFIRYYKNIVRSLTYTLNPFVPICISKNYMQEKETISSNRYGWEFPALGWLFLQYFGGASVLRKQSPQDRKIPSAPVTGKRLL